jgi:hypothetical protein
VGEQEVRGSRPLSAHRGARAGRAAFRGSP